MSLEWQGRVDTARRELRPRNMDFPAPNVKQMSDDVSQVQKLQVVKRVGEHTRRAQPTKFWGSSGLSFLPGRTTVSCLQN